MASARNNRSNQNKPSATPATPPATPPVAPPLDDAALDAADDATTLQTKIPDAGDSTPDENTPDETALDKSTPAQSVQPPADAYAAASAFAPAAQSPDGEVEIRSGKLRNVSAFYSSGSAFFDGNGFAKVSLAVAAQALKHDHVRNFTDEAAIVQADNYLVSREGQVVTTESEGVVVNAGQPVVLQLPSEHKFCGETVNMKDGMRITFDASGRAQTTLRAAEHFLALHPGAEII